MHMACQACKTDVEPAIDRETLKNKNVVATTKALCPNCRASMPVSFYMMKTLASLGQFYSQPVVREAFSFECKVCDKVLPAVLSKDKKKALCSSCSGEINLSDMMIQAMKLSKSGRIDPQS